MTLVWLVYYFAICDAHSASFHIVSVYVASRVRWCILLQASFDFEKMAVINIQTTKLPLLDDTFTRDQFTTLQFVMPTQHHFISYQIM